MYNILFLVLLAVHVLCSYWTRCEKTCSHWLWQRIKKKSRRKKEKKPKGEEEDDDA
jgi:hypothetical protein